MDLGGIISKAAPIVGGIFGGSAGAAIGAGVGGLFGGGAPSGQAGAQAADPFASQRGMYQGILGNLYGGMAGTREGAISQARNAFGGLGSVGPMGGLLDKAEAVSPLGGAGTDVGQAGAQGPNSIMDFITSSPDYQFRMQEGQRALERSASAKGMRNSGGLLRSLVQFGQGQASSAYDAEIQRIMTMAGATIGSPGMAGQLISQGQQNQYNAQQNAIGAIGYGINQYMNRPLNTAPAGAIGSTPSWYGTGGMGTIT